MNGPVRRFRTPPAVAAGNTGPPECDRGTVSMFTAIFTIAVILLAGLLVDGGLAIHARERASDIAEQAARAGANEIDEDTLRATGEIQINPDSRVVCGKVNDLVARYDSKARVTECELVTDDEVGQVKVTIRLTVRSQLLGIVPGLSTFTMTGTAFAHPDEGNP